jgi:hypothetical protein
MAALTRTGIVRLGAGALAVVAIACGGSSDTDLFGPSPGPDGPGEATGGAGGSNTAGSGGGATSATGGATSAGAAAGSGTGGATSGGSGGAGAATSAAGSSTAGSGGADATGGRWSSGGSWGGGSWSGGTGGNLPPPERTDDASVACGDSTCTVGDAGYCCFSVGDGEETTGRCDATGSQACAGGETRASCDGPEDCEAPAVCCATFQLLLPGLQLYTRFECANDCRSFNEQVACHPGDTCATGTCSGSLLLPDEYRVCQ